MAYHTEEHREEMLPVIILIAAIGFVFWVAWTFVIHPLLSLRK